MLGQWKWEQHKTFIRVTLYDNEYILPKFQFTIYSSLNFRVSILGLNLIASHPLYTQNDQSVRFLSLCDLIETLKSFTLCCSVPKENCLREPSKTQWDVKPWGRSCATHDTHSPGFTWFT